MIRKPFSHALLIAAALGSPLAAQVALDAAPNADAFVSSSEPAQNFGSDNFLTVATGPITRHAYVQFDLSAIPKNAAILRAELLLPLVTINASATSGLPVFVEPVVSLWRERTLSKTALGIRFSDQPDVGSVVAQGTMSTGTTRVTSTALTQLVQDWVRGETKNFGVRLRGSNVISRIQTSFTVPARERSSTSGVRLVISFRAVAVATATLPEGRVGESYSATLQPDLRGVSDVTWRASSALPSGLAGKQVGSTFRIEGRPTVAFDGNLNFEVADAKSDARANRAIRLVIRPTTGAVEVTAGAPIDAAAFGSNAADIRALRVRLRNDSQDAADVTRLRFFVGGSGRTTDAVESVSAFLDSNDNGDVEQGETLLGITSQIDTSEFTSMVTRGLRIPAKTTRQVIFVLKTRAAQRPGIEVALSLSENPVSATLVGSNRSADILIEDLVQGAAFFAQTPSRLEADANGDGAIDVRDLQILARNLGSAAPDFADPNGSGLVDAEDVEIVVDAVLERPVLTDVPPTARDGGLLELRGFDLGVGSQDVEVRLDGQALRLISSLGREKVVRLSGAPGPRRIEVVVGGRKSRGVTITLQ